MQNDENLKIPNKYLPYRDRETHRANKVEKI